jgi:ketosteroid isomerase-like protein
MSREDVEVVRRVYEAAARRDSATVLGLYARDVKLDFSHVQVGVIGGQDVVRGHDGLRSWFRAWHEAWETVEYDFEELIDAGEHVIAVVKRHARGPSSAGSRADGRACQTDPKRRLRLLQLSVATAPLGTLRRAASIPCERP